MRSNCSSTFPFRRQRCRTGYQHCKPRCAVLCCAGCENAVEAQLECRGQPLDVFCKCGGTFCFNCKEEAHRPVRCWIALLCCLGGLGLKLLQHAVLSCPAQMVGCLSVTCGRRALTCAAVHAEVQWGSRPPHGVFSCWCPGGLRDCEAVDGEKQRGEREPELDSGQHKALPKVHVSAGGAAAIPPQTLGPCTHV